MLSVAVIFVLGYLGIITDSYLSTFLIQGVVMLAMPVILYSLFVSKNVKQTFSDFGFKKIKKHWVYVLGGCIIGCGRICIFKL